MLDIFNSLEPFFEDNYRRINVREYARLKSISPPSASKILKNLVKVEFLKCEEERRYLYFYTNLENTLFVNLQRLYWSIKLRKLIEYVGKEFISPVIILFGSFSKAEINENSDIDLAIFSISKRKLDLKKFEKNLKRKIQVFTFKNRKGVNNEELLNNILNGFILGGSW